MRLPRFLVTLLAVTLAACQTATAPAPEPSAASIEEFAGYWEGSTVVGDFERVGTVEISPAADGTLVIFWKSMRAGDLEKGEPALVAQDRTVSFESTGETGRWVSDPDGPDGPALATARLEGRTLTVELTAPTAFGRQETQIYERTLTGPGELTLVYRRLLDGQQDRTVTGTYVRTG